MQLQYFYLFKLNKHNVWLFNPVCDLWTNIFLAILNGLVFQAYRIRFSHWIIPHFQKSNLYKFSFFENSLSLKRTSVFLFKWSIQTFSQRKEAKLDVFTSEKTRLRCIIVCLERHKFLLIIPKRHIWRVWCSPLVQQSFWYYNIDEFIKYMTYINKEIINIMVNKRNLAITIQLLVSNKK